MDIASLTVKAQMLKSLIDDPEILVLPNSWDVGSARIVEECLTSAPMEQIKLIA